MTKIIDEEMTTIMHDIIFEIFSIYFLMQFVFIEESIVSFFSLFRYLTLIQK